VQNLSLRCAGQAELIVHNNTGTLVDVYGGRGAIATVRPGTSIIPIGPDERSFSFRLSKETGGESYRVGPGVVRNVTYEIKCLT